MARRGRRSGVLPANMASTATTNGSGPHNAAGKQIPLHCSVCPEAPRFSDVSHLLTHIASKGHLHHETQTKLKAHQDLSASIALQEYEQWYKEHGIEVLLVERMKAKQVKEAARNKRSRSAVSLAPAKTKRLSSKRSSNNTVVKTEENEDSYSPDFPIFPGFFPPETDHEIQDDFFIGSDMLSLKGQVWPGMRKMDLANDEMKRTRNQRKPRSVIEKMRRTSEGIEPTQVVLTSEFEVERIKGVYDESESPGPDQEDEVAPRKTTRAKRKKPTALAEISANIPRGGGSRRSGSGHPGKIPKSKLEYGRGSPADVTPSLVSFRHNRDIFQDDEAGSGWSTPPAEKYGLTSRGVFDTRPFATLSQREQRFDLRDRLGMPPLNPMTHPSLISPTPSSRDIPSRGFGVRESTGERSQRQPYFGHDGHVSLGAYHPSEPSYAMTDAAFYNASGRMPFTNGGHYGNSNQDHFRFASGSQLQPKQEDYANSASGDSLSSSGANQFLTIPGANPLFSQDRMFLNSYAQTPPSQPISSLGFTPINRSRENAGPVHQDQEQRAARSDSIKLETQISETIEDEDTAETRGQDFHSAGIWEPQAHVTGLPLHDSLDSEQLEI